MGISDQEKIAPLSERVASLEKVEMDNMIFLGACLLYGKVYAYKDSGKDMIYANDEEYLKQRDKLDIRACLEKALDIWIELELCREKLQSKKEN